MPDTIHILASMLQRIDDLATLAQGYTPLPMVDWALLRKKFKQEREKRGLKQEWVAQRGRIDQGTISKIESTDEYMPSLETFLRAVHGLNMTATEFLAPEEGLQIIPANDKQGATLVLPDAAVASLPGGVLDQTLQAFILDLIDKLQDLLVAHRRRQEPTSQKTPRKTRHPRGA